MFTNRLFTIPLGWDGNLEFVPKPGVTGDITGWTLFMTWVTELPQDNPAVLTKNCVIDDGPEMLFHVPLVKADTVANLGGVGAGHYFFSVWRTNAGANDEVSSGEIVVGNTARRY